MIEDEMIHGGIRLGRRRRPRIELETPIVPHAVARAVWEEASVWLNEPLPAAWIGHLTERANAIYGCNPRFRSLVRRKGNAGRDWLWAFTRHWIAGLLSKHRRELYSRLPDSYSVGRELRGEGAGTVKRSADSSA